MWKALQIFVLLWTVALFQLQGVISLRSYKEDDSFENIAADLEWNQTNYEALSNRREKSAVRIMTHMNQAVDPCNDFYEYACGNFGSSNLRNTENALEFHKAHLRSELKVKLKQEPTNDMERKTKAFYEKCLEFKPTREDAVEAAQVLLEALAENWENGENWHGVIADWSVLGMPAMIKFVGSIRGLYIEHVPFGLENLPLEAFIEAAEELYKFGGIESNFSVVYAKCAFNFLQKLHSTVELHDSPGVDLEKLLQRVESKTLTFIHTSSFGTSNLAERMGQLLAGTDPAVVKTVLVLHVLKQLQDFVESWKENFDRSDRCYAYTEKYFRAGLLSFAQNAWGAKYAEARQTIIAKIRSTLLTAAKVPYYSKLRFLVIKTNLEKFFKNEEFVSQYYSGVDVETSNFLKTFFDANQNYYLRNLVMENVRGINSDYDADFLSVETSSIGEKRAIIPLGVQSWPLFDTAFPFSMNFGGFGTKVAGELLRVLVKFLDEDINSERYSLSSSHKEIRECFAERFLNLTSMEATISKQGFSNFFIDSFSLGAVYETLRDLKKNSPSDVRLSVPKALANRNINADQLFFLSFANRFCSRTPTSILKARVNGAVMNSGPFGYAFNCEQRSPMNPVQKCPTPIDFSHVLQPMLLQFEDFV